MFDELVQDGTSGVGDREIRIAVSGMDAAGVENAHCKTDKSGVI